MLYTPAICYIHTDQKVINSSYSFELHHAVTTAFFMHQGTLVQCKDEPGKVPGHGDMTNIMLYHVCGGEAPHPCHAHHGRHEAHMHTCMLRVILSPMDYIASSMPYIDHEAGQLVEASTFTDNAVIMPALPTDCTSWISSTQYEAAASSQSSE